MRFFEQVEMTVFDNGFIVATDYLADNPKTSAAIVLGTGGFHDPVDQLGCSHFMEHLLGHSNRDVSQKEFSFAIRRMAIAANLSTDRDSITAYADGRTSSVMTFMHMAGPMFIHGAFTPDHVVHEREPIVDEVNGILSSRKMHLHHQQLESVFGQGARPTLPIGGIPEHLERISYDQLRAFWRAHVVGANMMFVSAGGLTHKEAVDYCRDQGFDMLPRGVRRPRYGGKLNMRDADFPIAEKQGKRVDVRIRFNASGLMSDPDMHHKLDLVEMYLTNVLMGDIRFDDGLLYNASADYTMANARERIFSLRTGCYPEIYEQAVHSMHRTVSDAARGDTRLRSVFDLSRETVANIVAEHAADLLGDMPLRRKRMVDGLLTGNKMPDVLAEQRILEGVTFEEATKIVGASVADKIPSVEHWGHIGPERFGSRKIASVFSGYPIAAVA